MVIYSQAQKCKFPVFHFAVQLKNRFGNVNVWEQQICLMNDKSQLC